MEPPSCNELSNVTSRLMQKDGKMTEASICQQKVSAAQRLELKAMQPKQIVPLLASKHLPMDLKRLPWAAAVKHLEAKVSL